jgi:hypothetical protein
VKHTEFTEAELRLMNRALGAYQATLRDDSPEAINVRDLMGRVQAEHRVMADLAREAYRFEHLDTDTPEASRRADEIVAKVFPYL